MTDEELLDQFLADPERIGTIFVAISEVLIDTLQAQLLAHFPGLTEPMQTRIGLTVLGQIQEALREAAEAS